MAANLLPNGRQAFATSTGIPLVGGLLYTYVAGTNTPAPTWKDAAETALNTNPVVLDARGEASVFWDGAYKIILRDALGNLVWSQDNVLAKDYAVLIAGAITDYQAKLAMPDGSVGVGHEPAAPGSVPTNVYAFLNGLVVSVKQFGAKGDNIADDLQAFVDADAYLASQGGGTIRVPAGTYKISDEVKITHRNTQVIGDARDACVMYPTTSKNCFNFVAALDKGGWGVENLSIVYQADGTAGSAINAPALLSGRISNVYFERCFDSITLGNSQGTQIIKCEFWYFVHSGINSAGNLNDIFLSDLFFNGQAYGTSAPGLQAIGIRLVGKAHAVMADKIEIIQCARPMSCTGGSGILTFAFTSFVNCFFDSSANPVLLENSYGVQFIGCWFSQRATGVMLNNCTDTKFIGCKFTNNDQNGAVLSTGTRWTLFSGCTFDSNGQKTPGTFNGIVVADGVSDITITDCLLGNLGLFGSAQGSGISLAGNNARVLVSLSTFSGNTFAGISQGANVDIRLLNNNGLP